MSKYVKGMIIDEIRDQIGDTRDLLVVNSSKMTGVAMNRLRLDLQKKQIKLLGVKNALARRALDQIVEGEVNGIFEGPSVLIWGGEDIVALSKEIAGRKKEFPDLEIKGGIAEGKPLRASDVEQLSKSPGRPELLSQIAGLILSPGGRLAAALLGPGGKLAGQLKTLADKEEPAEAAPAAEASAEPG